jgi:hypothetical protein
MYPVCTSKASNFPFHPTAATRPRVNAGVRQQTRKTSGMIQFTEEGGKVEVLAETRGYRVYLDNDSLIELAKGSSTRLQRFVDVLRSNAA